MGARFPNRIGALLTSSDLLPNLMGARANLRMLISSSSKPRFPNLIGALFPNLMGALFPAAWSNVLSWVSRTCGCGLFRLFCPFPERRPAVKGEKELEFKSSCFFKKSINIYYSYSPCCQAKNRKYGQACDDVHFCLYKKFALVLSTLLDYY